MVPRSSRPRGLSARGTHDVGEHPIQGLRHTIDVEGLDEKAAVADLAAGPGAEEASELLVQGPPTLRRLPLEPQERR